jgi:hypothetical protein
MLIGASVNGLMQVILSREALWTAAAPAAAFEHVIQSGGCATALHSDFVAKESLPNRLRCLGHTKHDLAV